MPMLLAIFVMVCDDADPPVTIPLKGLTAKCCERPVQEALSAIPNVDKVTLKKSGSLYFADVVMKRGHGLPMTEIDKALAVAQKEMGDAMGTKYLVDDSLSSAFVHVYLTKTEANESKLKSALKVLVGFKSAKVVKGGFSAVFDGQKIPPASEVRKRCGLEILDLILAASKDGVRYSCPTHPEGVSPLPGKCPVYGCDTDFEKQTVGPVPKPEKTTEETPKKKGG